MNTPTTTAARQGNLAFIDAQNLTWGVRNGKWAIDHNKFRTYLREKYNVVDAYYYLGYRDDEKLSWLYERLQNSGFILSFKPFNKMQTSRKKGNVDTDVVFAIMRLLYKEPDSFDKIVLVSGDGDFYSLVRFLIAENRFEKILLPHRDSASLLYNKIGSERYDFLNSGNIRPLLEYKK